MIEEHPLTTYLREFKERWAAHPGAYRAELERLTTNLDISLPTLYRIGAEAANRRTLSPVKAMMLEMLTFGKVPAGAVNDEVDYIIDTVPLLTRHRAIQNDLQVLDQPRKNPG